MTINCIYHCHPLLNSFPIVIKRTNKQLMIWKAKRNCLLNSNPLQSRVHLRQAYRYTTYLKKKAVAMYSNVRLSSGINTTTKRCYVSTSYLYHSAEPYIWPSMELNVTWMLFLCDILLVLKWEERESSCSSLRKNIRERTYPIDDKWGMMKSYI